MNKKSLFIESIIIFLKGLLMGSADIVPGVSGGTIALITGIYSRLIDGINGVFDLINKKTFKLLFTFKLKSLWKRIKTIDFPFFIPLALGIGIAFVTLAHGIEYLLENHQGPIYAFFLGLILASAYYVYRKIDHFDRKAFTFLIIGALVGFIITGLKELHTSHSSFMTFISGAIAITAMILPGISGSAMLVMMGQYTHLIHAIKGLEIKTILIFGTGALIGILAFSKVLNYLIHHKKKATFAFLIGLMLGSLRIQYNVISQIKPDITGILIMIGCGIIGFATVLLIEKLAPDKSHEI